MLLGWIIAIAIGAILWKTSFNSQQQELQLKCENRVEVNTILIHHPSLIQ
jgi:hypothetical protein